MGDAIVQSMLVGAVGTMFYYMLTALGNKSIARLMKITIIMLLITILAPALYELITDAKLIIDAFFERVSDLIDLIIFWR